MAKRLTPDVENEVAHALQLYLDGLEEKKRGKPSLDAATKSSLATQFGCTVNQVSPWHLRNDHFDTSARY